MGLPHPLRGCVSPESTDASSAALYTTSTVYTPAMSPRSLKRSLEHNNTPERSTNRNLDSDSKRQRVGQTEIFTPPVSPQVLPQPLRITIPHEELTNTEQRILKLRIGHAERWKPKLQRPFPTKAEIKQAYQFKLMRHYTDPRTVPEPNYIKPHIDRSQRVDKLRSDFPGLSTSTSSTSLNTKSREEDSRFSPSLAKMQLERNKAITKSEAARYSAWKNFSSREEDRIDRGREAMIESGLSQEELTKESMGEPNKLPGWRKEYTSKYAQRSEVEEDGALSASG
ncbi:hypothetical protein J1614_005943 [Plenodomus biglobosus]|nr:hypothetical protein J1614_005943 [Plenodomus biglobosus]